MEERTLFYYLRDEAKRPVVTVCLRLFSIDDETICLSRGVAICSPKDMPRKATGRKIAADRAYYGLEMAINCAAPMEGDLMVQRGEAMLVIYRVAGDGQTLQLPAYLRHKARVLKLNGTTDFEKALMVKAWPDLFEKGEVEAVAS